MLASPSDVKEERLAASEIIIDWNNIHSISRKTVLLPIGWELNSTPTLGDRPQAIINDQVLKNADLLVGIFWTRIGTSTGKAISGTVEEIEEHIKSGKPAMLYFSNKPINPGTLDQEQYNAVRDLKKEYQNKGLTSDFDSVEEFRSKFQKHLSIKVNSDYFKGLNSENFKVKELIADESRLTEEARTLLLEASKDKNGLILSPKISEGFFIETNGKRFSEFGNPRSKAIWEGVLEELVKLGMIKPLSPKNISFELTNQGYKHVDKLQKSSLNNW
jgi:hypothetical protein